MPLELSSGEDWMPLGLSRAYLGLSRALFPSNQPGFSARNPSIRPQKSSKGIQSFSGMFRSEILRNL